MMYLVVIGSFIGLKVFLSRRYTGPSVFEACEEYKRMRTCEARLLERLPTSIDCASLKSKFDTVCSQADIDYANKVFRSDADVICSMRSKAELAQFKSTFDRTRIGPTCYQAGDTCGLDCLDMSIDEVP
jgi:hypothetical protein